MLRHTQLSLKLVIWGILLICFHDTSGPNATGFAMAAPHRNPRVRQGRKLLNHGTAEHSSIQEALVENHRSLRQFAETSPDAQVPVPAPAPGPSSETSTPPYINPFVPAAEANNYICCCQSTVAVYTLEYQQPSPQGCCCGLTSECCANPGSMGVVCGGGQVCGILMLMAALVGVLILSVVITGAFMARRRRQHAAALQAQAGDGAAGAGTAVNAANLNRPTLQLVQIPSEQLAVLYMKPPPEEEIGTQKECPICLESIELQEDSWSSFPCTHGCCKPCLTDLLRHSSRRVNSTTVAVLCPLCRKMAVAPSVGRLSSSTRELSTAPSARVTATRVGTEAGTGVVLVPGLSILRYYDNSSASRRQ